MSAAWPTTGSAQQISFQSFSQVQGLANVDLRCLHQDVSGYLLACTEHGLYAYDGQRFFNLGPQQGLPNGGVAFDLVVTAQGKLVIRYANQIFVSRNTLGLSRPPEALSFRPAVSKIGPIFNTRNNQMAGWNDGAVLIHEGHLLYINAGDDQHRPSIENLSSRLDLPKYDNNAPLTAFGRGKTLWVSFRDGRVCAFDRLSRRCFGPSDGLPALGWVTFLPIGNTEMLVRSRFQLATINLARGTVVATTLPYQGDAYANFSTQLILLRTPSGKLLTQSNDGLMIRTNNGWKDIAVSNGMPSAQILYALFDHENNLWLGVLGIGVMKALGYGLWENWQRQDGLSSNLVWQIARQPGGPLWISTDRGIDAIGGAGGRPLAHRHYSLPSYAIAIGERGRIWSGGGNGGVSCIDTKDGQIRQFALSQVDQIFQGAHDRLWFLTEDGVYFSDDSAADAASPERLPGLHGSFVAGAADRDGSLWMLHKGTLLHRHTDGAITVIRKAWSQAGFLPLSIAIGKPGVLWVGGAGGGLYRVEVADDRVIRMTNVNPPYILSNTVVDVMVDRRGWIWASTDSGVSVFNGTNWVSADTGNGLVSNDLNQGSLYEDFDGSVWIGTTQGLSHLLRPQALFRHEALQPIIVSAMLANRRLSGRAIPYSQEPLTLRFGALNVRSVVRFRYRLEGVDKSWADSAVGTARYPALTPGHHRFTVVAYDPLTREHSSPVSVMLRMERPWWLWWPLITLYAAAVSAAIYGVWRLRFRYLLQQQRALHREVELRTSEMRAAQDALILLATQDSLTKLLTRGEIQKRLIDALAEESQVNCLTIGLIDIDYFKRINDRFGHVAGDEVLKEMGLRLKGALAPGECGGRYGGEELLIVLTDAEAAGLSRIHDLKLATCGEAILVEDESIYVTCSIGVARAVKNDSWTSLIGRADRALYQAKAQGRDRIIEATSATVAHERP